MKQFIVVDMGERVTPHTQGHVGVVDENDPFVTIYPIIGADRPTVPSLAVHERTRAEYRMCGSRVTRDIVRVS